VIGNIVFGGKICLTGLKMDGVAGRVCPGVVVEVKTPVAAQKAEQVAVQVVDKAKEQAAKDKMKWRTREQ